MAKPLSNFTWSTQTNYTTGPDIGTPTKVAPSSGERAEGFVPDTAAVPQNMNSVLSEIAGWLLYVAGLASDSEFLSAIQGWVEETGFTFAEEQTFEGGVNINGAGTGLTLTGGAGVAQTGGGGITSTGNITASGSNLVTTGGGDLVVAGDGAIGGTLGVTGLATTAGIQVGSGTIRKTSRDIVKQLPLNFSPTLHMGVTADIQSWLGGGGTYGFHFWGYEAGGSLNHSQLEFTIPVGAVLKDIRAIYTAFSNGMEVELFRHEATSVGNTTTSLGSFSTSGAGADNDNISVSTTAATSDTHFSLELTPSGGPSATAADYDIISALQLTYSTTHADEND